MDALALVGSIRRYSPIYIVIQHVEGIEAGIYRLCAECGMLHVIERGDFSSRVQMLQMVPNVVSAPANLVCYLAGDYAADSHLFGNRAYRIMNLEAGLHRTADLCDERSMGTDRTLQQ